MASKKRPAAPAPRPVKPAAHAKRKEPAKPTPRAPTRPNPSGSRKGKESPPSKGSAVGSVLPTAPPSVRPRGPDFETRVRRVLNGEAERIERKEKNIDVFASMPDFALPDLGGMLGDIHIPDPIADAASELRCFGPDLDDSPVSEDDETLTHEDQEALRLAELHKGFRERMANEAKRRELATDTEFWVCVVFQDRDQKDQFLRGAGWEGLGDKYIDGEELAERIDVHVDKSQIVYNIGGADPKLAALVDIDPLYNSILDAKPEGTRKERRKGKA
jgi:hypothetical protein